MDEQNKWRAELLSPDVNLRAAAAEKLCQAGSDAMEAAVDLVRACGDVESVNRWTVAALEDLGKPPLAALEPLSKLVSASDSLVAYWAVTLLGRLGPDAAGSQKELAKVLTASPDVGVKERIAWALAKIGATSDDAVQALSQVAKGGKSRLSQLAQDALLQTKE